MNDINVTEPVTRITPEKFWEVFALKFQVAWRSPDTNAVSLYNDGTSWTKFLTDFLLNLAPEFGCYGEVEWRKIDISYFDKSGDDWGEWAMEAAIEIENGVNWTEEISKLLFLNAGLKVLIAYDDSPDNISSVLNRFLEIRKSRKYLTENDAWLFIFGPRIMPSEQDLVAFKFTGEEIANITGDVKEDFIVD